MQPIKRDGVIVEFRRKFVMHTGHGARGFLGSASRRGHAQQKYIYQLKSRICTHTKHSETREDPQASDSTPPNPEQGVRRHKHPEPLDTQNHFVRTEADEDGAGDTENRPTGTMSPGRVPLAHATGRQEIGGQAVQSVAVSPHVTSPSDPAGSGVHSAAAPPGGSVSVDRGDPGPGRRLRGEGLGPESTSGLSPPPGFRTTGVGGPRPRPRPPHTRPWRLLPGGHARPAA